MIFRLSILSLLISFNVLAAEDKVPAIQMVATNSPVKESSLKISITGPAGFEITSAKYLIKDAISLVDKSKKDTPLDLTKSGDVYIASINVNHLSPGQYRMYLKVKDKNKHHDLDARSSKKHVFKEYLNFVIDSSLEVKDPGEEGKKTLAGTDSDNDGIRDDIQRFINANTQGEIQMAYKQFARVVQHRMINNENKELSNFYNHRMTYAIECLYGVGEKGKLLDKIESILANTKPRIQARLNNMKHFHGESSSEELTNSPASHSIKFCEF